MSTANLDCTTVAQRMHEFLDGELADNLRPAMERHLAGCADCSTTLAELRRLENAHHQLDAQLKPPPEAYWHHLPQQVMERVRASERRRLLALPRLPRFKTPVERVTASKQLPASNMLHLPPAVRTFLRGPGKYVLPLAAVAAFCFFMIQELRRDDRLSQPAAMQAPDSTAPRLMTAKESEDKEADRLASIPQEQPMALRKAPTPALPSAPLVASGRVEIKKLDSLALATKFESAAGGAGAVAMKQSAESAKSLDAQQEPATSSAGVVSYHGVPQDSIKITLPTAALVKAENQWADTGASRLAQGEVAAEYRQVAETPAANEKARAPEAMRASTRAAESHAVALTMNQPAGQSIAAKFSRTWQQAQQTTDLSQREKIWRDFLATHPDSAHRSLAIFHLAATLAAASDSTSKPDDLAKNIAFFRDHAAGIRPHMGEKEFDRELARLQTLLTRRKALSKP